MKNWTIGKKLTFLSTLLIINTLIVGSISYLGISKLVFEMREISDQALPSVKNMTLADMMHDGIRATVFHSIILSGSKDSKEVKETRDEFADMSGRIQEYLTAISKLQIKPETKKSIEEIWPEVKTYIARGQTVLNLALEGQTEKALSELPQFKETFESLETKMGKLDELVEKDAEYSRDEGNKIADQALRANLLVIALGVVLGVFTSIWMSRGLIKQLKHAIVKLSAESTQVNVAASSITVASQNLAQASTQQASALQETAASIEEMNAMVKKSTENANRSRESATESYEAAAKGKKTVEEMTKSIEEIHASNLRIMEQVNEGNKQISEIVQVIMEIGNKTKVINDIVFQTKLLSFNASVEAARAGEHGKGFAVVAEEVGNLAQMSGNAAKEIAEMLSGSVQKVESIVNSTKEKVAYLVEEGKQKVETGVSISKQCAEILEEVVKNSNEVNHMVNEISTASQEQSTGINEITKAMGELDQTTHENSATSQQAAHSAQDLVRQAASLSTVVDFLESLVEYKGTNRAVMGLTTAEPRNVDAPLKEQNAAAVIPISSKQKPDLQPVESPPMKMAVGSSLVPSNDDPRFRDV